MTDKLRAFLEYASKDDGLCNKVNGLKEQYQDQDAVIQATIDIAGEHGFVLTADDFKEETRELSDDELDSVAGGSSCGCFLGGGGASSDKYEETCACAIAGAGTIYSEQHHKWVGRCACPAVGGGTDNPMY